MKRVKHMLAVLLAVVMIAGAVPLQVFAAEGDMTVTVSTATSFRGADVDVTLILEHNPGVSSLVFDVYYDEVLTLTGVDFDSRLTGAMTSQPFGNPVMLMWIGGTYDMSDDLTFATLHFTVSADAAENSFAPVTVTYDPDDIYNVADENVPCDVYNGGVSIIPRLAGDIDSNNKVNSRDVSRLMQYIARWDVTVNEPALDTNGDGKVNSRDVSRLMQYIARWDVPIYIGGELYVPVTHTHTLTAVAAVEPTCTEDGNIAYWHCADCGKYFTNAAGTQEVALVDTVLPATGHSFVNDVCTKCGAVNMPIGTECTIQYNVDMIHSTGVENTINSSDNPYTKYTVGTTKVLPTLQMDKYTFVGWSDQNGRFYTNNVIPTGVTGDLILTDNWVSQRNQAKVKSKLDDPLVVEDADNQRIYFGYEIGTIENVPLFTTQELLCANGIITVKSTSEQTKVTEAEMSAIGSTISKETVDSTQITLSEELTSATQINEEKASAKGYDREEAEIYARSQTNTQSYSTSSGGSSESYVYNDSTHRNEQNASYVVNENFDTGISFELQTGLKNTTEVSAGIGLPIDIIKVDAGVKNTTEVSLNTDTKTYADYSIGTTSAWDGHTYDESYQANSTTDTKTWNSTASKSLAVTASQTNSITEAFHEMITNTYSYGESYSRSKGSSELRGLAQSNGQTDETSFAITYTKEDLKTETISFQSTGNTFGSYRGVMMGTIHVFAIVGYDVANREYFVYTLNVMGDGSKNDGWHEELDYSVDGSFSDHENSVIPFAIPAYVEDYVNSRIVSTAGLEYEFNNKNHTAAVEAYTGTDKIVYVPSYMVDEEGTAYKVTAIKASAFKNNTEIVAVSLGRYVSEIPDSAFEGCSNLEYVICPAVRSIGSRAFFGCESLKEFQISKQIVHLGSSAFEGVPAVIAEVGYHEDAPEAAKEVAEMAASCGADSITLDLSAVPADTELLLTVEKGALLVLKGGEKTFTDLRIVSHASITRLESINICLEKGIPAKIFSGNVTLYKSDIETGSAYALLLGAEDTTLNLSGTNTVRSTGKAGIVCKSVHVYYTNSGKVKMDGDILCCGTVYDASNRIEFLSGQIRTITEEEFERYKRGVFTITLDLNGGELPEGVASTIEACYGDSVIDALPVLTRDYYYFDGWFTTSGDKVTADTVFDTAEDLTLTARWSSIPLEVTFEVSGGSGASEPITVYRGVAYGELPTPERAGYTFNGWYTAFDNGAQILADTIVDAVSDHVLYAHWNPVESTVSFDANGGSVSQESLSVTYDTAYGELPTPVRNNYDFVGWYTASDGGTAVTSGTIVSQDTDHTLYAHWAIQTVTVPNFSGEWKDNAIAWCNSNGINYTVEYGYMWNYSAGMVVSNTSASTTINKGSTVVLNVSSGPKPFAIGDTVYYKGATYLYQSVPNYGGVYKGEGYGGWITAITTYNGVTYIQFSYDSKTPYGWASADHFEQRTN